MLQFDEARRLILETVPRLPLITLPLLETLNMIAAETVSARWSLPSFRDVLEWAGVKPLFWKVAVKPEARPLLV